MKCRRSFSKAMVVFTLSIALFLTPFSTEAAGNMTISVAVEPKLAVRPLVTLVATYDTTKRFGSFSDGLAVIGRGTYADEKYGYMNPLGVEVIPCQYTEAYPFLNGYAKVGISNDGDLENLLKYGLHTNYGIIDKTGNIVVPIKYDEIYVPDNNDERNYFFNGLAVVKAGDKYGYVNKSGLETVPPKYDQAEPFSEGLALVKQDGKYGFIDTNGMEVVPPVYDAAESFFCGFAKVNIGYNETGQGDTIYVTPGKWGYIDRTGREITPIKYDIAGNFSSNKAFVNIGGSQGVSIVPGIFYNQYTGGKWGYVDTSGREVIPVGYDDLGGFCEGVAYAEKNGKYGFIDKSGNFVIPPRYERARDFYEGRAAVQLNGKWGFIDKSGTVVVSPEYDLADRFSYGLALVGRNEKEGYIDRAGNEVIPLQYGYGLTFENGTTIVHDGENYVRINTSGDEMFYDSRLEYSDGFAPFSTGFAGEVGYKDTLGNIVVAPQYDRAYDFSEGYAWVEKNGRYGILKIDQNDGTFAVKSTYAKVVVDGNIISPEGYIINGSPYFKLRSIAYALNESEKQFSVEWDSEMNAITLQKNHDYTAAGGEGMFSSARFEQIATISDSDYFLDKEKLDLETYDINGDNYVKLRDLGKVMNFDVDWDEALNTITITSSRSYSDD